MDPTALMHDVRGRVSECALVAQHSWRFSSRADTQVGVECAALNAFSMMACRTPAVLLYGGVALRAFALRGRLGHHGLRRFLLRGTDGV